MARASESGTAEYGTTRREGCSGHRSSSGARAGVGLDFPREGARVVVVDINRDGGEETVAIIKEAGGDATFVAADVSKSPDIQAMVQAAVDAYGGLDCAHNNAAISLPSHPLAEVPEEDWQRGIAVDLTSVFLGMKYEVPAMLRHGGGAIVNTASAGGLVATTGQRKLYSCEIRYYRPHKSRCPRLRHARGQGECHLPRRHVDPDASRPSGDRA